MSEARVTVTDAAVEAAEPWIANFLERRGLVLRGKEASVLARYVLDAAAPHLIAFPMGMTESEWTKRVESYR